MCSLVCLIRPYMIIMLLFVLCSPDWFPTRYITKDYCNFLIFLPQPTECQGYRYELLQPAPSKAELKPKLHAKHTHTHRAASLDDDYLI